jgi:iduronate 2-sulfatase
MSRRLLFLTFVFYSSTAVFSAEKTNILFIISDDLSAEALSCYGNQQCRTPNVDSIADGGMKFTRAYCQFPVCGPSRAALMSGMYAQAVGVTGNGASGNFTKRMKQRPSMAQLFKDNGWYTARVSKIYHMRVPGDITNGVDGPDHAASWTERFNCQAPEWMSEGEHIHLTNEKLNFDPDKHYGLGFGGAFYVVKGSDPAGTAQADVKAAAKAVELLEAHRDEPFFLAVGLVRPHVPLVAPKQYFKPYPSGQMDLPEKKPGDWDDIPKAGISKNSKGIGLGGQPGKQQQVLSAYYASVSFMDDQVGKILSALDRLGLRENTIVIFTADHGYHLGEHDFWQKMSLHEESTRIPLIVSVPGRPSGVSDSLVQQIDIYPTLAELNGLPIPEHVQGKSFAKLLDDPKLTIHKSVYCLRRKDHLLRTKDWAYIRYANGAQELYDMRHDPRQFTNLIDDGSHAAKAEELKTLLAEKLKEIDAGKLPAK